MLLKYVIGSSSAAGIRFLAFLILVKALGVNDYGIITFYLSIATIASTLAPLGTYNSTIRKSQGNEKITNILFFFISPSIITSIIFLSISQLFFEKLELMIYIYLAELFGSVLPSYVYAIINTTGNQVKSAKIQFGTACINLCVSITVYFTNSDYIDWAKYYFISGIITFSLTIFALTKIYTGSINSDHISIKNLLSNAKKDRWNTLSIVSRTIFFNIDKIALNYILPPYIYGIYSICIKLTSSIYLFVHNTIHYFEPAFFKYGFERNLLKINELRLNCTQKGLKIIIGLFIIQVIGISILTIFSLYTDIGTYLLSILNIKLDHLHLWVYMYLSLLLILYPMAILWIYLYILNGLKMEKERMLVLTISSLLSIIIYGLTFLSYYLLPIVILMTYYLPIRLSKIFINKRFPKRDSN